MEGRRSAVLDLIHLRTSDHLTLHFSTFFFTSSSSSFKISSLLAAEDAPGPAPAPVLLLELLAAWFSLWYGKKEAHLWSECQECWVKQVCKTSREIWHGKGYRWQELERGDLTTKQHWGTLPPLVAVLPFSLVLWNQHLSPEQNAPTERS